MQKLVQILVLAVVLGAGGYGALKGYIYLKVKGKVDDAIVMAGPYADISYGGIASDLRGSVAVEDITIAPRGAPGGLRVGLLQLRGPNLGFLLDLAGGEVNPNEVPERLNLHITDLKVPAGEELMSGFDPTGEMAASAGLNQDPCSLAQLFRPDAAKLANPTLNINASIGYQISRAADQTRLVFDYDIQDVESLSMEVTMRGQPNPAAMMMGSTPSLGALSLNYALSPNHAQRAIQYCAADAKQSRDEFIDGLLARSDGYYERALGFVPGPGIREALGRYMRQPGEISVTAYPPASLEPSTLAMYKPEDMVSLLGLNVTVNGQPLQDLSFTMPEVSTSGSAVPDWIAEIYRQATVDDESAEAARDTQRQSRRDRPAEPKRVKRFLPVEIGELKHYVGSDVRIYTTQGGKRREGILVSLQDGEASVQQRVGGGKITSHTPLADIKKAEVLRYEES